MAGDSDLSLGEARAIYFAANSIPPDGRYGDRWVHVRIGPIPFAFPNTTGRRRVLAAHDLHHVLTGYKTNIRGEGALAAWEIGAGCRDRTGLRLELRVLGFALVRWPRELFHAFVRGRRCGHLLGTACDDRLLARPVGSVRQELGLTQALAVPSRSDRLAFIGWASLAAAIVWGPLIPLGGLVWWLMR